MKLGEFAAIDWIRARVEDHNVRVGIGDDCAVFTPGAGMEMVTTTDMLLEGVHFRLDWTDLRSLGQKSLAVNLSDVAAMGAVPKRAYLSLAIPKSMEFSDIEAFMEGFLTYAKKEGVTLAGGDTCASLQGLVVSVTVEGELPVGRAVLRSGACPGDLLMVTGCLGESALALHDLTNGRVPSVGLAQRHHRPEARTRAGALFRQTEGVTSMIDLSDGLFGDAGHIARLSGVGIWIYEEAIPLSSEVRERIRKSGELRDCALSGGEDYELLLTIDPASKHEVMLLAAREGIPLTVIGSVVDGDRIFLIDAGGSSVPHPGKGFDHFAA